MLRIIAVAIMALLLLGGGAARAAEVMGLPGEQALKTRAKVVDLLCELTGDCPAECGAGTHQLGLRLDDGRLLLAAKDVGPFTGATKDLLPYCGKTVTVDGVITRNFGATLYMVQSVAAVGGKAACANRFVQDWAKAHGARLKDRCTAPEWYRQDETVAKIIAEQGKLGTGK